MALNTPIDQRPGTAGWTQPVLVVGAVLGFLVAGTVALWAHFGTAVFYEMVLAGIAACF